MHVMLNSSEICLYVASMKNVSGSVDAWVLRLEPKNLSTVPESSIGTRGSVAAASASASVLHPDVKLPWFDRRPMSEMRKVPSHAILMKVRVAPCLYFDDEDEIRVDGYLLSHGFFNYDLRGKNEKTVATPVANSHSRKFSSTSSSMSSSSSSASSSASSSSSSSSYSYSSSSLSSSSSSSLLSSSSSSSASSASSSSAQKAASASVPAPPRNPTRNINGATPVIGDLIKVDGVTFHITRVTTTNSVDDNGNFVFFMYIKDPSGLRLNNYIRSTETYELLWGKKPKK